MVKLNLVINKVKLLGREETKSILVVGPELLKL